MSKTRIVMGLIVVVAIAISAIFYFKGDNTAIASPAAPNVSTVTVKSLSSKDFINMTDSVFFKIKEQEIMKMLRDSAQANGIKPAVFCGLSWHESDRFKFAHRKIKDSNGKWSYGLYMIQMETALSIDKKATEEKLLTPAYNAWCAAQLFKKNFVKYGNRYNYAIAAHNAGIIYHDKITNPDFVKSVYVSIGEIITKNDF